MPKLLYYIQGNYSDLNTQTHVHRHTVQAHTQKNVTFFQRKYPETINMPALVNMTYK